MLTPADRLRSLVKEATDGPWFTAQTSTASGRADGELAALAPQLAELVADMGEALAAIVKKNAQQTDTVNAATHALTMSFLERLAALFPEDSA